MDEDRSSKSLAFYISAEVHVDDIIFRARDDNDEFDVYSYRDSHNYADHAGCLDTRKSTSGRIQFLGDKLISWMSKKQDCTAMSSTSQKQKQRMWRYLRVVLK
ncbi:hypothetical protein Tco_0344845 [Tanacetum coccineum]